MQPLFMVFEKHVGPRTNRMDNSVSTGTIVSIHNVFFKKNVTCAAALANQSICMVDTELT